MIAAKTQQSVKLTALFLILTFLWVPLLVSAQNTELAEEEISFDPEEIGLAVDMVPNPGDAVGDFVVGPGKIETTIEPGASKTFELTITNRTGVDRRFSLDLEDATGSKNGAESIVLLGDDRGPYSVKDYISAPSYSFDLRQGQRVRLPVTITVPEDAEPGGLYGSVLVTTTTIGPDGKPEAQTAAARSPIISRIGVLLFITIPGDVLSEGALSDVAVVPEQVWFEKGPINFAITYENTGVVHLNPYGELSIQNMFGEEVGFVELEPWFVMPQSVRVRDITWNREMLYGKYTATVRLNRGYDDVVDEKSVTFWIIPWKIMAAILVALFVVFFLLRSFFRTFEFKRRID